MWEISQDLSLLVSIDSCATSYHWSVPIDTFTTIMPPNDWLVSQARPFCVGVFTAYAMSGKRDYWSVSIASSYH